MDNRDNETPVVREPYEAPEVTTLGSVHGATQVTGIPGG